MIYITTTAPATIDAANGLLVQVNAALTGTITITDGGTTKAIITNPGVGNLFRYYGFTSSVVVTASTSCNVTVSVLNTTV
jgi:hypothetical protein